MDTKDGARKQAGKLYVKGNEYRIEMSGGSEYAIIRHDKNKSWIVMPDLNFPIRTSALNGSWRIEYANIETSAPDHLFEIPETYQKITMPASVDRDEMKKMR
jgi:hypothetical protein